MTIPSNYYANVAKDGMWFCTIELGEGLPETAEEKFAEILKRFPEAGWSVTLWKFSGGSKKLA